jgi:spore coat protein SA
MPSSVLEVGISEVATAIVESKVAAARPARVYHLLDEAEPFSEANGGAISRWAANVLREGHETIVCPDYDSSWGFTETRLEKLALWQKTNVIHPVLYRMPWVMQKAFYLWIFRGLLARTNRGDVIYVHNRPECASVLSSVAKKYGITVVLHMHNSHLTVAKPGQLKALKNSPIIFCSDFLRREIEGKFPGYFTKTAVVYNGADVQRFYPGPFRHTRPVNVVFTGRVVGYKGAHVLLEAMRILLGRGVDIRCKIVGGSWFGGSKVTRYMRKLQRTCPSNTELVGYKAGAELSEILRDSDIFCCPSIWNDPFPLAPIEAMATGLPVVASRVGGIPEALQYGGGLMVPPNDPLMLANALEALASDSNYRLRLREEGIHAADRKFRWANVREQYDAAMERFA